MSPGLYRALDPRGTARRLAGWRAGGPRYPIAGDQSPVAPPLPEADRVCLLGLEPMTFGSEVGAIFWRANPACDAKTKLNPQVNPQRKHAVQGLGRSILSD
jgi:hypothetical protein